MALTATPRRLVQTVLNNSLVSRYKNTTGQKQVIKEFVFCNRTGTKGIITLAIVPNGETLSDKHYIFNNVDLFGNETKIFSEFSTVLELNDDVYVLASQTTAMYISAAEFTTIV